jgi:hypothetical protein
VDDVEALDAVPREGKQARSRPSADAVDGRRPGGYVLPCPDTLRFTKGCPSVGFHGAFDGRGLTASLPTHPGESSDDEKCVGDGGV